MRSTSPTELRKIVQITFLFPDDRLDIDQTVTKYQCCTCEYWALTKSSVELHERIHLRARPFRCESCDFGANQAQYLKKHMQNVHGVTNCKFF